MCGIAGFVDFAGHDRVAAQRRLKRMTDSIVHRGPDGEGFYVDDRAALGHRRLAIIDVAGGRQPMGAVADGRVQIVFNGEIYNHLELRRELESRGHAFATRSDTEAILAAYLEWGSACVERLAGMFAFALWDGRGGRLLLARDRVGKKPLYYRRDDTRIAFASEIKALRALDRGDDRIDVEALDCYFSFGYVPGAKTIYTDVAKLLPAHLLEVDESGTAERCYWKLGFGEPEQRSFDDVVDELEALTDEAVRCRLMSEVPLGAFLSGGVDSSVVVASMARALDRPVVTSTIGFVERDESELPVARRIADTLATDHHEFTVEPQAAGVLERIAAHFDEPLADSSALPTWYVCEMTRRNVTVALSGDGGDEAFGGYTFRYAPHAAEARIRKSVPAPLRALVFGPLGSVWPASARLPRPLRLKTLLENLAVDDARAFYADLIWLRSDARARLYRPELMAELRGFSPFEVVQPLYTRNDAPDALGRSQYTDIHLYMTDDVLVKVDRMSMAHSLEVRSPLLDHRVLEFAARLPASFKLRGGRGKLPLRALAERRLPREITTLPKKGFSIPAARWLRGELRGYVEDVLFAPSGALADFLDRDALRGVWAEHQSGARDHHVFLWGAMMLGLWDRQRARQEVAA